MLYLILGAASGLLCVAGWALWLTLRQERVLAEAMFGFRIGRSVPAADYREDLPHFAAVVSEGLQNGGRTLLALVAMKYDTTSEALERALIADTGAASLEEALQAPQLEDWFLAFLTTRNPIRLGARWWLARIWRQNHDYQWARTLESASLPMLVILTLAAIMLLAQSVRTGAVGGFLRGIGTLLR